jgi:hypothetical protein
MGPTEPKVPVREVGGHNFYQIQQADQLLHSRFMVAEIQELYIRAGISESFLKGIADLLISKASQPLDVNTLKSDMFAIGQNLKQRVGFIADKTMYEELACVYFLMDDEPNEYTPEFQAAKKALWREHPDDRDFFIVEAFRLTNASQDISQVDICHVWEMLSERLLQLPTME